MDAALEELGLLVWPAHVLGCALQGSGCGSRLAGPGKQHGPGWSSQQSGSQDESPWCVQAAGDQSLPGVWLAGG